METIKRRGLIRNGLIGLLLAIGLMGMMSGPASALASAPPGTTSTDRPKITEQGHDFGENWDTIGAPRNGGHLYWDVVPATTVTLEGWQYWKNVSGICAKMQVIYHDPGHAVIQIKESNVYCANGNAMEKHWVDITYTNSRIDHVVIKLNVLGTNGVWQTVDSVTEHP